MAKAFDTDIPTIEAEVVCLINDGQMNARIDSYRCLRTCMGVHGSVYNFWPKTFVLPVDYTRFVNFYAEEEQKKKKVRVAEHAFFSLSFLLLT
jgi:hypothetical protein